MNDRNGAGSGRSAVNWTATTSVFQFGALGRCKAYREALFGGGPSEQVTLADRAPHAGQQRALSFGFYPFRHDGETQGAPEVDDCPGRPAPLRASYRAGRPAI